MHTLFRLFFRREFSFRPLTKAGEIIRGFSFVGKIFFWSIATIMAISAIALFSYAQAFYLIETPRQAGSLTEGIIGSPRFINPILATTDADRDLVALTYAGLLRISPDGTLIPELAESYEIADEGTSYIFTLKNDVQFHDGSPITADDVIFTIEKVKDPNLKSPKWASWNDVTVEKIDEKTIAFKLKVPYAPFLQNTTLGILPKKHWKNTTAEQFPFSVLNIQPIGAGPYKIITIKEEKNGIPSEFSLQPFNNYVLGEAYIKTLKIRFYTNETLLLEAFNKGDIESINSIAPETAYAFTQTKNTFTVTHTPLLRVFGVYFNTSKEGVLVNKEVRQALDAAINKETIIQSVLFGFGSPSNRPTPPGLLPSTTTPEIATTSKLSIARSILEKNGWTVSTTTNVYEKRTRTSTQTLSFSLAIPNAPELKQVADIIIATWTELGAEVSLNIYEQSDLHQSVIRPRRYDALLFGQIVGRDIDLYPFWHSSQRNDPGYNIALYANVKADTLLEEARRTTDQASRIEKYLLFEEEIKKDTPATFLYSPDFIYIVPQKIHAITLGPIAFPGERFSNIHEWYIETDRIWKFLIPYIR